MSAGQRVTHGDEVQLECPHCGEKMWMADDGRYAHQGEDECEHCGGKFTLETDYSVYTTASAT